VDGAGVLGVNPAKRAGEGVRALRHGDQVTMTRHEAVAQDGDAMMTGIVLEQFEVEPVVFGPKIGLLAVVPALGDVMGKLWQN
jgi:hypothetical protein